MRLISIAARAFKGLDHVELADLAPDLNLVVGPNESGKSRLVTALRYALFERYKGESEDKKALRSHGSTEPPSVEVSFETRGTTWTVKKQFLQRASARLQGGGRTWTDDDAEAKLRDLLGTRPIQGRRDVDQFLGLWPLLWVSQGEAGLAPQAHLNDDTRARLRDVLAAQVNLVAAGPLGERIVARAEKERERYLTATGKETGELASARAAHAEAEAAVAKALAKRTEAHATADELATLTQELGTLDARIAPQRARVADAAARAARVKEASARRRAHEAEAARRRAESELASRTLAQRDETAERLLRLDRRLAEERAGLAALDATLAELRVRAEQATAKAESAGKAMELAHAARLRAQRRTQLAEAARRAQEAKERLARARACESKVTDLRARLAVERIDEAQVQRVRRANDALTRASAALAAASASVRLRAARDLVVSGERLAEGEERVWSCDGPTRIVVEGVGSFEVRPGGADLDERRARDRDARLTLATELERLGVSSPAEAEDRFSKRTALAAQLADAAPLLAQAAPEGVARLEEDALARAADVAALGSLELWDEPSNGDAEARFATAAEGAGRARAERDALRAEVARQTEEASKRTSAVAQIGRERAEVETRLADLPPRDDLAASSAAARTAWLDAQAVVDGLAEQLAHAGESDAEIAHDQEKRALDRLEAERSAKHARVLLLDATVRVHGSEDLHERAQRAEAELEERATALRTTMAKMAAARELVVALHAARREMQERLVAPVLERARPYVEALLPGRRLHLDEAWGVVGVGRGDVEDAFDSLSGGAKEQVSILVRLALAEVLGEAEPLPIVLDDCLVNTDRVRLAEMLRILYRAAKKTQILVLSCHDLELDRLGESRRYELGRR